MPPKKKKGKISKLARMSDEERARYLQHRADVALEAKRRKQQLIAIFTKNKLKREEAFSRINTAKINEQWRTSLRQMKCQELKEDLQFLWLNFEDMLKSKDDFIKKLFNELIQTDLDHRKFQESHMMALDDIIDKGKERINHLNKNYEKLVNNIRTVDLQELKNHKIKMEKSLLHLRIISFANNKRHEEELMDIKTRNAINVHGIIYFKDEMILKLKRKIHPRMEHLWLELNETISNYENSTKSKREHYEHLKEQDDAHQKDASQFPKLFAQMKENAEKIRKNLINLGQEREEAIEDLKMQSELLTKRVCKMRQEAKMAQAVDSAQLKRLSVLSSEAIKNLQRILNKGTEIQTMAKLCLEMEIESQIVKKYSIKDLETHKDIIKSSIHTPYGFLKKIEGFRDHLYCIKEENNLLKREQNELTEVNNRLKHTLKSYLTSVSRIPTIRPRTRA